ncbi:hypothetical protein ROZALSC1DRAFT_26632 [Rozella allomycis CSF55]|uniref:Pescadillo homolog n=1 Tax=Rozella allomycis (strain CSF55) TaxID=988480 RepID=A0A4P9YQJ5_ROZAC|nr:hypothetical protein ROZALSC1DRAFT_26632 [Rozella allomycis CSF55]
MGKLKKKQGTSGAVVNYISRNKAIRKLQITLPEFRRLCILKGIYPREPNNKKKLTKGSTAPTTFYYLKDIQYLLHEPILQKFREHKIFLRKLNRAIGKGQKENAVRIQEMAPKYTLDHVIRERYPTFIDAVRDLDDALCMIYLFSMFPQTNEVEAGVVEKCQRLCREFEHYIIKSRSLVHSFVSVKGIYYQAMILGQAVTWLVPFEFSVAVPHDVDFRVMMTFCEFYITLLGFINFKLYSQLNLVYPPQLDQTALDAEGGLSAYKIEEKDAIKEMHPTADVTLKKNESVDPKVIDSLNEKLKEISKEDKADELKENFEHSDELVNMNELEQQFSEHEKFKNLFAQKVFFISREAPRLSLEFIIRSFGGKVGYASGKNSMFKENDPRITHHIVDRPLEMIPTLHSNRSYVQPQWIYDCINSGRLLDPGLYAPGVKLPAHLSPFEKSGDYVPTEAIQFFAREEEAQNNEVESTNGEMVDEKKPEETVEMTEYQEELAKEMNKVVKKRKKTSKEDEEKERKEMAIGMMNKKDKNLYNSMMFGKRKRALLASKLKEKKLKLQQKE